MGKGDPLICELKKILVGWEFLALYFDGLLRGTITGWKHNITLIKYFFVLLGMCTNLFNSYKASLYYFFFQKKNHVYPTRCVWVLLLHYKQCTMSTNQHRDSHGTLCYLLPSVPVFTSTLVRNFFKIKMLILLYMSVETIPTHMVSHSLINAPIMGRY